MWRSRNNRDGTTVTCIACGTSLPRSEAREYDKEGDRWERHGKSFEHLCKECYRGLCHQPRDELESLLVDVERAVAVDSDGEARGPKADGGADSNLPVESDIGTDERPPDRTDAGRSADADAPTDADDRTFLAEYFRTVEERYGPAEEPGRES